MARITIEHCLKQVKNRFDLVWLAAKRARVLAMTGEQPRVSWDHDKTTVVALREIEAGYIKEDGTLSSGADEAAEADS